MYYTYNKACTKLSYSKNSRTKQRTFMNRRELFESICEGGCLKICQKVSSEEGVDKLSISSVMENFEKYS